jgi:NADPH:quinone reductase-like Zn-dependent oxidoreductase
LVACSEGAVVSSAAPSKRIFKNIVMRGLWIYSPQFRTSPKILEAMKLGARLVAEGKLRVPIAATYPLASAATALAHAEKGRQSAVRSRLEAQALNPAIELSTWFRLLR